MPESYLSTRRDFLSTMTHASAAMAFAAGIQPVFSHAENSAQSPGWFGDIYRLFHIDAHFGDFKSIYRNFDADACAQIYADAGVQMVSYFSKCWAGFSYYPTKIGVVHPGLTRDFTGELTRALKKRGIRCILYFMLAMDRHHWKVHPDWVRKEESTPGDDFDMTKDEAKMMCFRSPYVDEIGLPQMKELIELYDIDGFFIDIVLQQFLQSVCRCPSCRASFDKEVSGDIPADDTDPKAFAYRKWANRHMEAHMDKVQRALAEVKPDIEIINNYAWMMRYPVTPPTYVHHVTWDTPTPNVGLYAWNFSLEARYLSTLENVTWSVMNTRGNNWLEYSLREPEAFMSECATLLASCGRTYLSDIPYPSGNPDLAVLEVFSAVNRRTKELEPFIKDCKPVKDVAVLHSLDSVCSKTPMRITPEWIPASGYYPVCGAHKALIESHVQMGIVNSTVLTDTLHDYRALILADQRILSPAETEAIRDFVRNGGALVVTGETGTRDSNNNPLKNFSLADVLGIDLGETVPAANCYLRVREPFREYGIPAMDIQVMGSYTRAKTTTARTLLELVPPYEGIATGTPPPSETTQGPGITINSYGKGKALYCAGKLFQAYHTEDTPVLRKLVLWALDRVHPAEARTIVLEHTPANVEMFYNNRNNERFVHLVNYSGDKREKGVPQTRDFTTVHGIVIKVRLDRSPVSVTAVPDGKKISFTTKDSWTVWEADPLTIHSVYRIELS